MLTGIWQVGTIQGHTKVLVYMLTELTGELLIQRQFYQLYKK